MKPPPTPNKPLHNPAIAPVTINIRVRNAMSIASFVSHWHCQLIKRITNDFPGTQLEWKPRPAVQNKASNNHSREPAVRSLKKLPSYGVPALGQAMPKKADANTINLVKKFYKYLKKMKKLVILALAKCSLMSVQICVPRIRTQSLDSNFGSDSRKEKTKMRRVRTKIERVTRQELCFRPSQSSFKSAQKI